MASAHGHLNNEVMNNNRPPAPKFRKWLMRNNKSSLSGLNKVFKGVDFKKNPGGSCPQTPLDRCVCIAYTPLNVDIMA